MVDSLSLNYVLCWLLKQKKYHSSRNEARLIVWAASRADTSAFWLQISAATFSPSFTIEPLDCVLLSHSDLWNSKTAFSKHMWRFSVDVCVLIVSFAIWDIVSFFCERILWSDLLYDVLPPFKNKSIPRGTLSQNYFSLTNFIEKDNMYDIK